MANRPCLTAGCPNLTTTTRCPTHEQQHQQQRNTARGDRYGADYRRARKALLRSHPPCHWCGDPATTADHLDDVLVPACGPCNYQRGGIASGQARQRRSS